MSDFSPSRRHFVKTLAAGAAGTALAMPSISYGRIMGANERIRLGMIGVGQITRYHISAFQQEPDAEIVALADVYEPNLQYGAEIVERDVDTYMDFRRIAERDDIDAVVVGTPNHWHAIPTIRACEEGMDVYVEKPLADTIEEGRRVVDAAQANDRIVQLGTQQRASRHFQEAVELIREDAIGDISFVRTWNASNAHPDGVGSPPNSEPPKELDWDMWLGPAPEHPFNPNRFGVFLDDDMNFEAWGTWRWFWDHGGGHMTDWGVHWLDIVHWAMDVEAPQTISSMGDKYYIQDNRETPDTIQTTYEYPGFTCVYENRIVNDRGIDDHGNGIIFYGTKGTMYLSRSGFRIEPQPGTDVNELQVDAHGTDTNHRRDFLDSVKSREKPKSTIEVGHRSSSAAVLGNVAYRTGRTIEWDAETETVTNHPEAEKYVTARYRDPWSLEG